MTSPKKWVDLENEIIKCRRCVRLVEWREHVAAIKRRAYLDWDYWGKPVPGFGDTEGRVLVVGLAPGAHGSNRTGRMFTGDASGDFLYPALHQADFASQGNSSNSGDGLILSDIYITAVCRCAPPNNRPLPEEILNCHPFLTTEINMLSNLQVIVALGQIAFQQVITFYRLEGVDVSAMKFIHGGQYKLDSTGLWLLASYHPSRQNTQTGRLTKRMFDNIWIQARSLLK